MLTHHSRIELVNEREIEKTYIKQVKVRSYLAISKYLALENDEDTGEEAENNDYEFRKCCGFRHGLLYKLTELLYLTCTHEVDVLTLVMSQKLTQYL